jgi:hypothetical protein
MKIRQGFVSNSSSSSFCLYGLSIDESEIRDALLARGEVLNEDEMEYLGEYFYYPYSYENRKKNGEELTEDDKRIEAKFFSKDDGFEYEDVDGYMQFIGISWKNIRDDETGAEFKKRVENKLKELFPDKDIQCGTHEHAWYPG